MATWDSNIPAAQAALREGRELGLIAAAQVVINQVKRGLRGGYTSGDFVTGNSINHVTRGPVEYDAGEAFIRVGTSVLYNLYWELGHHNLFSGRYERRPIWLPSLLDTRAAQQRAYAAQIKAALAKLRPLPAGPKA